MKYTGKYWWDGLLGEQFNRVPKTRDPVKSSGHRDQLFNMSDIRAGYDRFADGVSKTQQAVSELTDALQTELPGLQGMAEGQGIISQESYNPLPIPE